LVDYVADTVGVARNLHRLAFFFLSSDLTRKRDHTIACVNVDLTRLHRVIRNELALHGSCDAGVRLGAGYCQQGRSACTEEQPGCHAALL
jgi:hypothetical protein